jgi:hypothetical protein
MMVATNFGSNSLATEGERNASAGMQKSLSKVGQTPDDLAEHLIAACVEGSPFYIFGTDAQLNPPMFKVGPACLAFSCPFILWFSR